MDMLYLKIDDRNNVFNRCYNNTLLEIQRLRDSGIFKYTLGKSQPLLQRWFYGKIC